MIIHPRWADRLLLLVILLLALALRVHRLGAQSLWYDEAVTAQVAGQGVRELTRWTADDIQPPLYYYVVAGWTRVAGRSEWSLRFPSAWFSLATVALLWTLARRLFGGDAHAATGGTAGENLTQRHKGTKIYDFLVSLWLCVRPGQAVFRAGSRPGAAVCAGRVAGLGAALLGALSPLYVYYGQEARMYAQLTFLGALTGYALLRAGEDRGRERRGPMRWWLTFVLAAAAMLYTHYFGAFLLLAFGLAWLARAATARPSWPQATHRRSSRWEQLAQFGLAAVIVFLIYLPWLPAMLTRYRVDRSYWQGSLKLGEAVRHLAISFTTGAPEMMLEGDAVRLLPWFGLALAVTVGGLGWAVTDGMRPRDLPGPDRRLRGVGKALMLAWVLILPTLAILALASRTPKFNARYLMMVSPAHLLLLAGGTGAWFCAVRDRAGRRLPGWVGDALAVVVLATLVALPVATSLVALRNWYGDPSFTKAQWREVASSVRRKITADEAVLLVSGHAYPAWGYYAPDIPALRLPDIDILDVEAVLGFEDGARLAEALAGKSGAWLVSWQAEAVDPVGFVPYFLDRAGTELPVGAQFWHVGLRHWRLRSDATYLTRPQPQHVQDANFGHQVALLGWDDPRDGQITVYWRCLNTILRDYQVSLVLEDAQRREIGRWDGRPVGYNYPTFRWRPGQALFGRYPLPMGAAPGGDYYVTLAVYDAADPSGLDLRDVADNPSGKRVRLGPVRAG